MKKFWILAIIPLLCLETALATPKVDPASYTIPIHVTAARYVGVTTVSQVITVVIDGTHYELKGPTSSSRRLANGDLLKLGDYSARLIARGEPHKTYEILLPDKTTRRFTVIAQAE